MVLEKHNISPSPIISPVYGILNQDYKAEDIVGYDIVTAKGGKVETIELVDGFSTTKTIEKMRD